MFKRLFELALPTRLVGVTEFAHSTNSLEHSACSPQSHSRADLAKPSRVASVHSAPPAPCFVGKNFEKSPTGAFFLRFLLIPNRWLGTIKEAVSSNPIISEDKKQNAPYWTRSAFYGRSDWI